MGADGANGVVAKAAGLGEGIVRGVALEGNVPWSTLGREPYEGTAWVELGIVPGGYGWVFPKGDHANLGVGGWMSEGPRLRGHLDRLAREHGVDPATLENVRGHRLPMREPGAPAARGRVLLVGDAAGLVDPLSGDGMYEAFVSAELAADGDRRGPSGELRGERSRPRSIITPPRRGRRSASPIAIRARACGRSARPASSVPSPAFCAATLRIRARRVGSLVLRCARSRGSPDRTRPSERHGLRLVERRRPRERARCRPRRSSRPHDDGHLLHRASSGRASSLTM